MHERRNPTGAQERRNYTPPGRLRRIFHDHRASTVTLLLFAFLATGLFLGTTAWAGNERFKSEIAEIAYTHDSRALLFLEQREQARVAQLQDTLAALDRRHEEAKPELRPYLVVSLAERRVYYIDGKDTLFRAPVAVGSGKTMVIGGETMRFQTPRGRLRITHKERNPVWVPPNWHYVEIARKHGLRVVDMSDAPRNALARFPAGREPIANGTIYIPPWGSPQRRHSGVLGVAKLEMYDGYYFHGTDKESTVGDAVSHGCIRLRKDDILWMYDHVPVGTSVYIY
jgi:lipoprotein-anchoring transpeptidase ErfK/SrfK